MHEAKGATIEMVTPIVKGERWRMLNPNTQFRSWETSVQEALAAVLRDVEDDARKGTLRKKLRTLGYHSGVIKEVVRRIFDDDEVVVEMAQHPKSSKRFTATTSRR